MIREKAGDAHLVAASIYRDDPASRCEDDDVYDHENDSGDDYCDCNYDGDVYDDEDDNDKDRSKIKRYYPT